MVMADPQFTPDVKSTPGGRALAFAARVVVAILFLAGKHLAGKSCGRDRLGYWLDLAGCYLHEFTYRRTARLRWKALNRKM